MSVGLVLVLLASFVESPKKVWVGTWHADHGRQFGAGAVELTLLEAGDGRLFAAGSRSPLRWKTDGKVLHIYFPEGTGFSAPVKAAPMPQSNADRIVLGYPGGEQLFVRRQ
jgi:hypothetical protein